MDRIQEQHKGHRKSTGFIPTANSSQSGHGAIEPPNALLVFDGRHPNDVDFFFSGFGADELEVSPPPPTVYPAVWVGSVSYQVPSGKRIILRGFSWEFLTAYGNATDIFTSIFRNEFIVEPLQNISTEQVEEVMIPTYHLFEEGDTIRIVTKRTLQAAPLGADIGYKAAFYGNLLIKTGTELNMEPAKGSIR